MRGLLTGGSMRFCLGLAAAAAAVAPVSASGGFWCTADDPGIKFTIESGLTRGMGNPLFGFKGELEIKAPGLAADLRKSVLTQENLAQHWLDNKMLNLQLHVERPGEGPFGEIDLTIETKLLEEGSYEGSYTLGARDMTGDISGEGKTVKFAGKTKCSAE